MYYVRRNYKSKCKDSKEIPLLKIIMKNYLEQHNEAGTDQVQNLNLNIFCFTLHNFSSSLSE